MRPFRVTPRAYRKITFLALAALVAIILSGAAVRLTDSGLGCPDWPTCQQHSFVAAWQYHAVVEFANRCFTAVVTAAVVLAVLGAALRDPRRRDLILLSLGLVLGVLAQVVLGGLTVLYKLDPPYVMAHFLLSIGLVWNGVVLFRRAGRPAGRAVPLVGGELVWLARLIVVVTAAVVAMGTVVTGAGPHAGNADAPRLAVSFKDMAEIHSSIVMLLSGLVIAAVFALHLARAPLAARRTSWILLGLIGVQAAVGYSQYFLKVPALLVELHVAGATAIWIAVVALNLDLRSPVPDRADLEGPRPAPPDEVLTPT